MESTFLGWMIVALDGVFLTRFKILYFHFTICLSEQVNPIRLVRQFRRSGRTDERRPNFKIQKLKMITLPQVCGTCEFLADARPSCLSNCNENVMIENSFKNSYEKPFENPIQTSKEKSALKGS